MPKAKKTFEDAITAVPPAKTKKPTKFKPPKAKKKKTVPAPDAEKDVGPSKGTKPDEAAGKSGKKPNRVYDRFILFHMDADAKKKNYRPILEVS